MPLTVQSLKQRYQDLVAPGDNAEFERLLLEADERLLASGRWHWTRKPDSFSPSDDGLIVLPEEYESIVGCRVGGMPQGIVWQETEYLEGGPGEISIEGCSARLVDQGWTDALEDQSTSDESDDVITRFRTYKVSDASINEVDALCRFAAITSYASDWAAVLCPSAPAIKQMMLSIVYEEANDTAKSLEYRSLAINTCNEHEKAYRGLANEVFKPLLFQPVRRRSRTNFA
jgi:hypothetical protein